MFTGVCRTFSAEIIVRNFPDVSRLATVFRGSTA